MPALRLRLRMRVRMRRGGMQLQLVDCCGRGSIALR